MDALTKGVLTAITVAVLLAIARLSGRRIAGLLAGLPTVTGPALVWLALDHGARYATEAAIGSIAACTLCAVFALAYERASRRAGAIAALALATIASVASAPPLHWLGGSLLPALLVAAIVSPAVQAALPKGNDAMQRTRRSGEVLTTALASGAVTWLVAVCATSVGPFWAGVLASPPLVAAAVVMQQHRTAGHAAVCGFLHAYVGGLLGRAAFGAGFALLIVPAGVTTATIVASLAGGALGVAASWSRGQSSIAAAVPAKRPHAPASRSRGEPTHRTMRETTADTAVAQRATSPSPASIPAR